MPARESGKLRKSQGNALVPHELAKRWNSEFNGGPDIDGDIFDLTNMLEDGDARMCTHGSPVPGFNPISGITTALAIDGAPAARYLVRINQSLPLNPFVRLQYRGVAIHNPDTNQINKIIGVKRIIRTFGAPDATEGAERAPDTLVSQEEGTWVATQP